MSESKIITRNVGHPFERAGLGRAPFRMTGCTRRLYQACHGAPIQPGAACDYCGTGIIWTFTIQSDDGKTFIVGSDCVRKTADTGLIKVIYQHQSAEERKLKAEARAAARAERALDRARQAETNLVAWAPFLDQLEAMSKGSHTWRASTSADMLRRALDGAPLSDKQAALVRKMWEEHNRIKVHVGKVGEMVDLTLTLIRVTDLGEFQIRGTYQVVTRNKWTFKDADGNVLVWMTGKGVWGVFGPHPHARADVENGKPIQVKVRAKIKDHATWQGEPETHLERCKVEPVSEEGSES